MSAAKQLEQNQVQVLPLKRVHESPLNPRKTFDEKAMAELAGDVAVHGVMQPILVRHLGKLKDAFEIIFGARRYRAAKMAKLETIPAFVVEMSDADALERMIVENCQREDVDALEEADGYRRLHTEHGFTADQIAEKVGKSRSFVYGRMKLCELAPKARKVVEARQLGAERALLIARIPDPERQLEAAKQIAFNGSWEHVDAVPMSFRRASEWVREHLMLKLAGAPFDTKDAELVKEAGPCTTCPFRTKNVADLFGDIGKADLCTKPTCFNAKKAASWKNERQVAKDKGLRVLSEKEARETLPGAYSYSSGRKTRTGAAFVALSDPCETDPKQRTWRQLAGAEAPKPSVVARTEDGDVVQLVPREDLVKVLEDRGHKFAKEAAPGNGPGKDHWAKQQEREKREREVRLAVAYRVMTKAIEKVEAGEGGKAFWRLQVDEMLENIEYELLERRWGEVEKDKEIRDRVDKMSEAQLRGFAFELVMGPAVYSTWNNQRALKSVCELYGIDQAAEKEALKAEQYEAKKKADQEARELDRAAKKTKDPLELPADLLGSGKSKRKSSLEAAERRRAARAAAASASPVAAPVCVTKDCGQALAPGDERFCEGCVKAAAALPDPGAKKDGTCYVCRNEATSRNTKDNLGTICAGCLAYVQGHNELRERRIRLIQEDAIAKASTPAPAKKRRMAIQDLDTAAERPDATGGEARS